MLTPNQKVGNVFFLQQNSISINFALTSYPGHLRFKQKIYQAYNLQISSKQYLKSYTILQFTKKLVIMKKNLRQKQKKQQLLHRAIERKQIQRRRLLNINLQIQSRFNRSDIYHSQTIHTSNQQVRKNSHPNKRITYQQFLKCICRLKDNLNWGADIRPTGFYTSHKIKQKINQKNEDFLKIQPKSIDRGELSSKLTNNSVRSLNMNKKRLQSKKTPQRQTTIKFGLIKKYQKMRTMPQFEPKNIKQVSQNSQNSQNININSTPCRPWSRCQKNDQDDMQLTQG